MSARSQQPHTDEQLLDTVMQKSRTAIFRWDNAPDWPVTYARGGVESIFGHTIEDFLTGRISYFDVIHPKDVDRVSQEVAAATHDPDITDFTHRPYRIVSRNGHVRWIEDRTHIIRDHDGQVVQFQGIVQDITQRIERQQQTHFQSLVLSQIQDGIVATDLEGNITYVNDAECRMFGKTREEMIGSHVSSFGEDPDHGATQAQIVTETQARGHWRGEVVNYTKDGSEVILDARTQLLYGEDGVAFGMIGISTDITRYKEMESKLRTALEEKDTLLRELYHRTKNNMQVISAMLGMQANADQRLAEAFRDMQNRISSMALVHEKLYQSQSLTRIDLGNYLFDLCSLTANSFLQPEQGPVLEIEVDEIPVSIDTAIPCGLIVNELISNSLKYAFPDHRKGHIWVTVKEDTGASTTGGTDTTIQDTHEGAGTGGIMIAVRDDGVGFPEGFDLHRDGSVGLQTVLAVGEQQLQGSVDFNTRTGAGVAVTFCFRPEPVDDRI